MKKTHALIIMDGYAMSSEVVGNAVLKARTPNLDKYFRENPHTLLKASGRSVGLPKSLMGNSKVGHLNIGAGRIVYQDLTRIDKAVEEGDFFKNPVLKSAMENAKKKGVSLHLAGLASDGGVHSSIEHLYALLKFAKKEKIQRVLIHIITDGRDTPPDSGAGYIAALQKKIKEIGIGQIASVCGRFFYMDRDKRWDRTERGYNCVLEGVGARFTNPDAAMRASYARGVTDEFIEPCVIGDYAGVNKKDSFIFFNFRADRARQITRAIISPDFSEFERKGGFKEMLYIGFTEYDKSFSPLLLTAFAPKEIKNTLGEYLSKQGKTQARVAETEKYAHVTFFFNGGVEEPNKGEIRVLVDSPKVTTYDLKPQMSAKEVTEKAIEQVGKVDVLIVNYANCDMVGHTGIFKATMKAVETVDTEVKKVIDAVNASGGAVLLTSDHGNAEQMTYKNGGPMTAHTTNPVPLLLISDEFLTKKLSKEGALCDIAPTLLEMMELEKPKEMDGRSLII